MFGGNQKITSTVPPSADLDPLLSGSPRYSENAYYPNNWGTNTGYSNNYNYYNTPANSQTAQYTLNPSGPPVVLYPHLYSTVNQNQIHLHLHGPAEKLDQYLSHDTLSNVLTPIRNAENEILPVASSVHEIQEAKHEVGVLHEQPTTTDPSSVWRPY